MKTIIIFILTFNSLSLCQLNSFHTPDKIKLFADYLFCQKDYLRAFDEYTKLDYSFINDTILFKLGYISLHIEKFNSSISFFDQINNNSPLKGLSLNHKTLVYFLNGDLKSIQNNIQSNPNFNMSSSVKMLILASILHKDIFISKMDFSIFEQHEREKIQLLSDNRFNPHLKSPLIAGLLSLIPGLGKIYTKNYSDGLTAFFLNGLLAYLTYNNFQNNHKFRGYLFAILGLSFYAGNIFGSVVSASKYNNNLEKKTILQINEYIKSNNYFLNEINFCK
jgi:hypothetical protein